MAKRPLVQNSGLFTELTNGESLLLSAIDLQTSEAPAAPGVNSVRLYLSESGDLVFIRPDGSAARIDVTEVDLVAPIITSANPSGNYLESDTISGTLTANETVTWSKLGADTSAVTLDANTGEWSLASTVGSFNWSFLATDGANNVSEPQDVAIEVASVVPVNSLIPDIVGLANQGDTVILDIGEWENAVSFEVRVQTDETTPVELLPYTATTGGYEWVLPVEAVGKNLILTVRATGVSGTQTTADSASFGPVEASGPYDIQVVDANVIGFNSYGLDTSLSSPMTIALGANSKLVVHSFFSYVDSDVEVSATFADIPMTLVAKQYLADSDGTRFAHQHIFELDNPPLGTGQIVLTRGVSGSTNSRWQADAFQIDGIEQGLVVDVDTYQNSNALSPYPTPTSTLGDSSDHIFTFVGADIAGTASAVGWDLDPGCLNVAYNNSSTSPLKTRVARKWPQAAGSFDAGGWTPTSGGTPRHGLNISIVWRALKPQEVAPIFYINAETGNDANDGLTAETAFKSLSALNPLSPFVAGTKLIFEDNQLHRTAAPVKDDYIVKWNAAGTSANPVEISTRNGGPAWIAGDEIREDWVASTEGETNATAVSLGAQKVTLDSTYQDYSNFPCNQNTMLHPAIWNPDHGYPSAITAWDDQVTGSDAYTFVPAANAQQNGATIPADFDTSKVLQYKGESLGGGYYRWTARFYHENWASHYAGTTPVGAVMAFRVAGNLLHWYKITDWDPVAGYVEVAYEIKGTYYPHRDCFYTVLCHPLDMIRKGQYSRSLTGHDIHAIWPDGTTQKSITSSIRGIRLIGNYWKVRNVGVRRVGADIFTSEVYSLMDVAGNHHDFDWTTTAYAVGNAAFMEGINWSRPAAVMTIAHNSSIPCSDSSFKGLCGTQLRHHSLLRNNNGYNLTVTDSWCREMGRTLWYNGGDSNGNRYSNLDGCEHTAVHGNICTDYQFTYDNQYDKVAFTGATGGITSQDVPLTGTKRKVLTRAFGSATRDINVSAIGLAGYTTNTPLMRIDRGETESLYDRILITADEGSSGFFGLDDAELQPCSNSTYRRMVGRRFYGEVGNTGVVSGDGSQLIDVLTSLDPPRPYADYGYTTTNAIVDPAEEWTGCLSLKMQQILTTNDARDGYEAIQLGPDKFDWQIEPYGTAPTLVDLKITTDWVREGHQAGKVVGNIIRTRPGSTLSLVSGAWDNQFFVLDMNCLVPIVPLTGAPWTVLIRETNAGATNGPYKDSAIIITVVG